MSILNFYTDKNCKILGLQFCNFAHILCISVVTCILKTFCNKYVKIGDLSF